MRTLLSLLAALILVGALAGCSVSTHEKENGKKDDVEIRTPLGSLRVEEDKSNVRDTGLALYPGARPAKGDDDSANVNVSSSFLGLKVVALNYQSDDSPDKILSFYRKEMGKYGKVVDCTGGFNLSFHRHDKDAEVTCEGRDSDSRYKEELKVGTENNQRILAVKPRGNGSEFALVYVRSWDRKDAN